MTEEQLYELIRYDDEFQSQVGIPNEFFKKLNELVDDGKLKKQHVGLAYSYIYIHYYMARYSTYDYKIFTVNELKQLLGYAKDNQRIDYIFKRNGILDQADIFHCTNDYPILSQWEENYSLYKTLEITFASELYNCLDDFRVEKKLTRNQFCKLPIHGFYSDGEWYTNVEFDGLFFSDNTEIGYTLLDFKVFAYCMSNADELGCNAFYLYAYLKFQNFRFGEEFKATQGRIAREIKMSNKTVYKYMDAMKSYNMITTLHNQDFFSINLPVESREASTHKVNTYDNFTYSKVKYEKMKVDNKYKPEIKIEKPIGKDDYKAKIALSDLPF